MAQLFRSDSRVRAVGIGRHGNDGFCYRVVRNVAKPIPFAGGTPSIKSIVEVPVVYSDTFGDAKSLMLLPVSGPGSPGDCSVVPEQRPHRPLVCGLQIQNYDADNRRNIIPLHMVVGTLGCFVRTNQGTHAMLSNNHVVAALDDGQTGDRILQAGGHPCQTADVVATLSDSIRVYPHPGTSAPLLADMNEVDAGMAILAKGMKFSQSYHPSRVTRDIASGSTTPLIRPSGIRTPQPGDRVFKVGRTTGYRPGVIESTTTIVGPVGYTHGACWFKNSFVIVEPDGGHFADGGDSGSLIVRADTGEALGLLYAGNGEFTFACPIDLVLKSLHCSLI
jgi:hypothetical protein